jgi:hypothetical protein
MVAARERLWRTKDGKLVRDGDEAATSLAYTPGDEVKPADEYLVPSDESEPAPEKSVAKPADKAATRASNK